jgi:hypothetical protein
MMADLLSYQGNAGLGLGSTPGIPAIDAAANLNVINQTTRDIMLLDNERNMKIFQQKINDRDVLNRMIMDDKVATGDILPKYQDQFDKAKKSVENVFYKWRGNFNDTKGFNQYKEAVQELKDVAAHAQTNTVEIKKLDQQIATEPLPNKQAKMKSFRDQQIKQDFWNPIMPYQQLHDMNLDTFAKFVQPMTTVETPDKNKPFLSYDVTRVDFDDIRRRTLNGYINDLDQTNDIDQLITKFQQYDQNGLKKSLDAIDAQIDHYNNEMGLKQGDKGWVTPVKRVTTTNGKVAIAESQPDFAAKFALANQGKYVTRTPKFQKDMANYDLGLKKLDLAAKKLGIEGEKARAYIRNLDAKTDKYYKENKDEATNVIKQYNDFIDNIKPGAIQITDKKTQKLEGVSDAVFLDELPGSYQYINGPIMAMTTTKDKKGTVTTKPTGKVIVGQLQPFVSTDKSHRPYYIPSYVDANSGEKVTLDNDNFRSKYQESKKQYPGLTYDEYIRALLKKGALEMVLKGQNGAANYTSMSQSAKLINAETTKKGRENVENPPGSVSQDEQDTASEE